MEKRITIEQNSSGEIVMKSENLEDLEIIGCLRYTEKSFFVNIVEKQQNENGKKTEHKP